MPTTAFWRRLWRRTTPALNVAALALGLLGAPAAWAAFEVNTDGTVTDTATGLVWDRCTWGLTGAGCATGSATAHTWAQALAVARQANADAYKGHADWRLPNIKELESLVKLDASASPYIDTAAFPQTLPSDVFWSSSNYAPDPAYAWNVYFNYGFTSYYNKTNASHVRLVRSGQSLAFFDALDTTPPVTTDGPGVTPGSNGSTASASVTVNEPATGYWQVLPTSDPAPDAASLLADGTSVSLPADEATTWNITGLTPGSAYMLYFIARDGSGNVQAAVAEVPFTTPDVPAAPANASAVSGDGQASVNWTAPADDGGSAITGYTATATPSGQSCTATALQDTCTVTGLTNGTAYTFAVVASNAVGDSTAAVTNSVTPQGAQTITFAHPGGQQVAVPLLLSASSNSGLTVTFSASGSCTLDDTTLSFATAGAGICTITASQDGNAAWAAAVDVSHVLDVAPGSNTISFGTQGGQTYAPGGTFAIDPVATATSGLTVSYSSLSSDVCTVVGTTVTIVSAGTCTLAANQAGDANWQAAVQQTQTVQIDALVPSAPAGVSATAGNAQATVSWTAAADNGSAITAYTVTAVQDGSKTCTTTGALSCDVTGLSNGTAYTFTVAATNAVGTGPASDASAAVTPAAVPDAPTDVAAVPGNTQVTVSWTAPADNGSAITGYVVTTVEDNSRICTTTDALSCDVTGLSNGTAYTFTVTATNTVGTSAASAPSNTVALPQRSFDHAALQASFTGGGPGCGFANAQVTPAADVAGLPAQVQAVGPQFAFTLSGCDLGGTVQMQIDYPSALPAGAAYWKHIGGGWGAYADAQVQGSTVVLSLTDGGAGDADAALNGEIVDPGVPVLVAAAPAPVATTPVPGLGAWALWLLAVLMGWLALPGMRRHACNR